MTNRTRGPALLLAMTGLLGFAVATWAAEPDVPTWDRTFSGHEMWIDNVDSAIALSSSANKPMLVDFYGRH